MSTDYFSPDNVLVVTFGDDPEHDANAYQALTDLKQLDSQGQIKIAGAAVVSRDADGRVDVKSERGERPATSAPRAAASSACSSGSSAARSAMLLGGTYGCSSDRSSTSMTSRRPSRSWARSQSRSSPTRTAVLAQVTEQSPEVIDTAMARLGGQVMRRPVVDVEQEIAAAQEAQRKAEREARSELRKARLEKNKEDAHAKVEELKSKLHGSKAGAAA